MAKAIFLILKFILIKIGQIPILIVKTALSTRPTPAKTVIARATRRKAKTPRKKIPIILAILLFLMILYAYTSFIFTTAYQLPSPTKLTSADKSLTTEFFDRNGKLLYRLYEGRNRTLVNLKDLPPYLVQATIAAEDKNFYSHSGVDVVAIARAVYANLVYHRLEGASTITQQLIKNTLLTPEKSFTRKIKEVILAIWTEKTYTKNEILQMYLNEAPYGGPAWGIEAASQTFFGQSSHDLTLAQAAFLAGLPASPTQYSPYGTNPELGKVRQKEVLSRMVQNKFLTQTQADEAYAENLQIKSQISDIKAGHFVMYVKDFLSQKYGQRVVSQGGLKITTTLDLRLQEATEQIVSEEAEKLLPLNVGNAAAMVTDAKTGQILAMVGSKDYHNEVFGAFNVALSWRQPGSSIKVATYATAFKQGFSPGNTIIDEAITFKDKWGGPPYSPVNYDGKYHGPVSLRTALGSSYNIPAVKVLNTVGIGDMIQTAKDLGITTFNEPQRYGLSLTLGGAEVKMIDMMTLYGSLSQMGTKKVSTPILKVTDSQGNVLEEYEDQPTPAVSPEVAYLITDVLADNNARAPSFGVNSLLKINGKTVAVKTGTSDNKRDNWTFGYTPSFVVGVWVGNNDNSPMNPLLTSGVTGAAPIWNRIMNTLLQSSPDEQFTRPTGIVEAQVDGRRDLRISNMLPKSLVRINYNATPSAQTVSEIKQN